MASARKLALETLREWSRGQAYAAALVDEAALQHGLAPRDAALLQTLVYGVLRNLSLLDHWSAHLSQDRELDPASRWLLRLGLAQLLILDMQPHAAVNETVNLATRARGFINAILRRATRDKEELQAMVADLPAHLRFSHPSWLVERLGAVMAPPQLTALLEWNQQPASTYVRINRLHPEAEAKLSALPGLEAINDDCFRCSQPPRQVLADGLCYAQDPSTLLAPRLLAPQPGMRVLDACAAPGGKTAYLAQLMGNTGSLVATDSSAARLRRMASNLSRMQVANTQAYLHDWSRPELPDFAKEKFDAILLDAPCTNTGVMRRRIDVRWRIKAEEFASHAAAQLALLESTLRCLKPGGVFVYSTCSIDPEENEKVVKAITTRHPDIKVENEETSSPQTNGFDGAYAARLVRG
jgi:16S rRNA (cytosine967-C5)-methyltransferase